VISPCHHFPLFPPFRMHRQVRCTSLIAVAHRHTPHLKSSLAMEALVAMIPKTMATAIVVVRLAPTTLLRLQCIKVTFAAATAAKVLLPPIPPTPRTSSTALRLKMSYHPFPTPLQNIKDSPLPPIPTIRCRQASSPHLHPCRPPPTLMRLFSSHLISLKSEASLGAEKWARMYIHYTCSVHWRGDQPTVTLRGCTTRDLW